MNIGLVVASNKSNMKLAISFQDKIKSLGHDTDLMDLVSFDFPLYTNLSAESGAGENLVSVIERANNCDGFIFITPEYNGGLPPVLTNFLAWVSVSGGKDWRKSFNGKPAVIASASGGGGQHALVGLRIQLAYIGLNVIGRQVISTFKKPDVSVDINAVCEELVKFSK